MFKKKDKLYSIIVLHVAFVRGYIDQLEVYIYRPRTTY